MPRTATTISRIATSINSITRDIKMIRDRFDKECANNRSTSCKNKQRSKASVATSGRIFLPVALFSHFENKLLSTISLQAMHCQRRRSSAKHGLPLRSFGVLQAFSENSALGLFCLHLTQTCRSGQAHVLQMQRRTLLLPSFLYTCSIPALPA